MEVGFCKEKITMVYIFITLTHSAACSYFHYIHWLEKGNDKAASQFTSTEVNGEATLIISFFDLIGVYVHTDVHTESLSPALFCPSHQILSHSAILNFIHKVLPDIIYQTSYITLSSICMVCGPFQTDELPI